MRCGQCDGRGFFEGPENTRIRCEECRGTGYVGGRAPVHAVKGPKAPESPIGRLSLKQFLVFLLVLWIAAYHLAADIKAMFNGTPIFPSPLPFYLLLWVGIGAATKLFAVHKEDRIRRQGLFFILFALVIKFAAPLWLERREAEILRGVNEGSLEVPGEVPAPETSLPPTPTPSG